MTFIRRFLQDHPRILIEKMTVSQINAYFVKLESAGTNKSYLHKFVGQRDEKRVLFVDTATVFISYAWAYEFVTVVVDVMEQCYEEDPKCYFWFDLFTNDQNNVVNKDFQWFCNTFQGSIDAIGKVIVIICPWYNPIVLTRAWCLLEIATSLISTKVLFDVKLPRSQLRSLKGFYSGALYYTHNDSFLEALKKINVEKATAQDPNDLKRIFEFIFGK